MNNNADDDHGQTAGADSSLVQDNTTEEPGSASFKSYLVSDKYTR